jgi:hypothetical protein
MFQKRWQYRFEIRSPDRRKRVLKNLKKGLTRSFVPRISPAPQPVTETETAGGTGKAEA